MYFFSDRSCLKLNSIATGFYRSWKRDKHQNKHKRLCCRERFWSLEDIWQKHLKDDQTSLIVQLIKTDYFFCVIKSIFNTYTHWFHVCNISIPLQQPSYHFKQQNTEKKNAPRNPQCVRIFVSFCKHAFQAQCHLISSTVYQFGTCPSFRSAKLNWSPIERNQTITYCVCVKYRIILFAHEIKQAETMVQCTQV